jgi:hypothetical protein
LRRCLAIVFIFAVVGPPVGGLVVIYGSEIALLRTAADFMAVTRKFADALPLVAGMSYVLGALPAVTAGLLVGIRQAFHGAVTWSMALGIGLIVGGAFAIAVVMVARQGGEAHLFSAPAAVMVIACVISTMACWALVRLWYGFSWQDES